MKVKQRASKYSNLKRSNKRGKSNLKDDDNDHNSIYTPISAHHVKQYYSDQEEKHQKDLAHLQSSTVEERQAYVKSVLEFMDRRTNDSLRERLAICGALAPFIIANIRWKTRNALLLYNVLGFANLLTDMSLKLTSYIYDNLTSLLLEMGISGELMMRIMTTSILISEKTGQYIIPTPYYLQWHTERNRSAGKKKEDAADEPLQSVPTITELIFRHSNLPLARFYLVRLGALVDTQNNASGPTQSAFVWKLFGLLMSLWYTRRDKQSILVETHHDLKMVLKQSPSFSYHDETPWTLKEKFMKMWTASKVPKSIHSKLSTSILQLTTQLENNESDIFQILKQLDTKALKDAMWSNKAHFKSSLSTAFVYILRLFACSVLYSLPLGYFSLSGITSQLILRLSYHDLVPNDNLDLYSNIIAALFAANFNRAFIRSLHFKTRSQAYDWTTCLRDNVEGIEKLVTESIGGNRAYHQHMNRARTLLDDDDPTSQISIVMKLLDDIITSLPKRKQQESITDHPKDTTMVGLSMMEETILEPSALAKDVLLFVRNLASLKQEV